MARVVKISWETVVMTDAEVEIAKQIPGVFDVRLPNADGVRELCYDSNLIEPEAVVYIVNNPTQGRLESKKD